MADEIEDSLLREIREDGEAAARGRCGLGGGLRGPLILLIGAVLALGGVVTALFVVRSDSSTTTAAAGGGTAPQRPVTPPHDRPLNILVFGDSWGDLGPSWQTLRDLFERKKVPAIVRSSARGGTRACQWAQNADAIVSAARQHFPNATDGPDFVWYTAGGNDMLGQNYQKCSRNAKTFEAQLACQEKATATVTGCTTKMLDPFFKAFPKANVMQCGYDLSCTDPGYTNCVPSNRALFCGRNATCMNTLQVLWQPMLLDPLSKAFDRYTGISLLGSIQKAGGVPGADVGKPVLTRGSPCGLMTYCVHPTRGKAGATAVGESMWELYFSKQPLVKRVLDARRDDE